jgi:hypothetical protein
MLAIFILKKCLFKHIALTGSSNKNLLFTDKFTFLQKQLFELGVSIFKHIALTGSSNKIFIV